MTRALPALNSFGGRAARRAIIENRAVDHDAEIGVDLDPAVARRAATRATKNDLILAEAAEHQNPTTEKARIAIARPVLDVHDGYEDAMLAAIARAAQEDQ